MNKAELVKTVSDKTGVTKKDAGNILNAVTESITDALSDDEKVTLVGFGTFQVIEKKAKRGRNPQTGKKGEEMGKIFIDVSTSKSVNVKPGEIVKLSDRIYIKGNSTMIYLAPHPDRANINYMQKVNVNELKRQLLGVPVGNNDILSLNMEGIEITLEVARIERYRRSVTDTILISDQTQIVKAIVVDGRIKEIT